MLLKGQSSVEYLATYGWMIVAVGVAGTAVYPVVSTDCQIEIYEDIRAGGIIVEQAGITANDSFEVVLDNDAKEEIIVQSMELEGPEETLLVVKPKTISPGGEARYPIGEVERKSSCQDYNINIEFEKGPLEKQNLQMRIRGGLDLVQSFASLIERSGDTTPEIFIDPSVHPTNETICFGADCPESNGTVEGDQYVSYSGDSMKGPLGTGGFETNCIGKKCNVTEGDREGYLNTEDGEMNGTLNITEVKPISEENKILELR